MNKFISDIVGPQILNVSGTNLGRFANWKFGQGFVLSNDQYQHTNIITIDPTIVSSTIESGLTTFANHEFLTSEHESVLPNSLVLTGSVGIHCINSGSTITFSPNTNYLVNSASFAIISGSGQNLIVSTSIAYTDQYFLNSGVSASLVATSLDVTEYENLWISSHFGSGADGDVTIVNPTTMSRDMCYRNLTLTGTGTLNTNHWIIYVSDTLDISQAITGAISNTSYGFTWVTGSLISGAPRSLGADGVSDSNGNTYSTITTSYPFLSGVSVGFGGKNASAGDTNLYIGGGGLFGPNPTSGSYLLKTYIDHFINSNGQILRGAAAGVAGSSGAANNGGQSSNGGTSGAGGGNVVIYANKIISSGSVGPKIVSRGEDGYAPNGVPVDPYGGSSGGAAGGAGIVYLVYNKKLDSEQSNILASIGGNGGNGQLGTPAIGVDAYGSQGGYGGICISHCLSTNILSQSMYPDTPTDPGSIFNTTGSYGTAVYLSL